LDDIASLSITSVLLLACNCDRLDPSEDIEENRRNLIALTQKVFDAIVSSADRYDSLFFSLIFCSLM
jgi:hypothetical protein